MLNLENQSLISVSKAASILGVSVLSLHAISEDTLPVYRTQGKHRRYKMSDVLRLIGEEQDTISDGKRAVIYSRVSSQDQKQKGDLDRQKVRNVDFCVGNGFTIVQTFEECSSGMNDNRPKLLKLIELAKCNQFDVLVIEHKDRLTRFNFNLFRQFFEALGVKVICVEQILPKSFENELVEDVMSIMQSYSSKIYDKRSHKNKQKAVQINVESTQDTIVP